MNLDERAWIYSGGLTPEWRAVAAARLKQALAKLEGAAVALRRKAPAGARAKRYAAGLDYFLSARCPERDRLALHPAFDYWLFLWDRHFAAPGPEENWHLQFGLFQTFPLWLAYKQGRRLEADLVSDPDGHVHFDAGPGHVAVPPGPLKAVADGSGIRLSGEEGFTAKLTQGSGPWTRAPQAGGGMTARHCGLLLTQGVTMHGLASPSRRELERFAGSLETAVSHIRERDEAFYGELTDMVRVLVPLETPEKHGSVSSSYVNLRGAICLSHSEDPLLQAETLIHEFCHQKMNQLLLVEPILLPGQSGQVFYSPWRADARRLRGLILGAHAFLNVASYLLTTLSREKYGPRARVSVMRNAARRLFEVEEALRCVSAYGSYTDFGRRFILGMSRELMLLFHAAQLIPAGLMSEARAAQAAHRAKYTVPGTGLHKEPA